MSNQRSMTDKVRLFAERISESGPSALSGLFDLTAQRLIRFATTITRNQHDAEDVVQDVLVRVAGRPELLCAANKPWHYLLQMVRNESLRVLRRQKKWNLVDQIGQVLARPCPDHLEQYDRNQAVLAALQSIPSEQGEVVALKIWEEMTFAEIGDVLQVSPATAASRYRYAIEKLTKTFGTQQAGGRRMNSEADVEQLIREVGDCVQPSSEMRPETMQRARELSDELHARGLFEKNGFRSRHATDLCCARWPASESATRAKRCEGNRDSVASPAENGSSRKLRMVYCGFVSASTLD